uniref:26S proteasome regulatory subunit RPN11 C-terminal domain-containing protein n=1 Tax=Panagrolaimus superbus TaxID=310955 RepID=A0A914Y2N5_9BILA
MESLQLENFTTHNQNNEESVSQVLKLSQCYKKSLEDEENMTEEQKAKNVGKQDPKRHLDETVNKMLADNIVQNLASMMDTASFQ